LGNTGHLWLYVGVGSFRTSMHRGGLCFFPSTRKAVSAFGLSFLFVWQFVLFDLFGQMATTPYLREAQTSCDLNNDIIITNNPRSTARRRATTLALVIGLYEYASDLLKPRPQSQTYDTQRNLCLRLLSLGVHDVLFNAK